MRRTSAFVELSLLLAAATAQSQPVFTDPGQKSVRIVRTATPPVIDGVFDEAEWRNAGYVNDLHQVNPVEYAPPFEKTEVYLLYDDDALYIGAKLYHDDPQLIVANTMRQGQSIVSDDSFYVTLDPFSTQRSGVFFGTNLHGVRYDGMYRNVSEIYDDWDGIYDAGAGRFEEGWIAEFRIPFKTLSFDPNIDRWGLNFSRSVQRSNERIAWVSRNRLWDPSRAGVAIGFEGLKQGLGLDVVPSLSYNDRRRFSPDSSESDLEPSLDVFYKITPAMNASLTFNTDFSATEVDDRQVNLTRFNLFFPEKRDFFLRESDIFEFGRIGFFDGNGTISGAERQNGRPFFSRSIGLSALGQSVDLNYGGKVSGRVGRWELGALSIRQDELAGIEADTLSVVRAKVNIGSESQVGVMATHGSPTANVDNSLTGVDFLYRNSRLPGGRVLDAFAWLQESETDGVDGEDGAAGIGFSMPSAVGMRGGLAVKEFEANFNPGLGFLSRRNVYDYSMHLAHTYRPTGGYVYSIYSGIEGERFEIIGGGLQSQALLLTPVIVENRTGDTLAIRSDVQREVLQVPFAISPGIQIPEGDYSFNDIGVDFTTSRFRKVWGRISYYTGDFYDGERERVSGQLRWQPSPKFGANVAFNVNYVDLAGGEFVTRIVSLSFDRVFSSTLSWVNLVQYDNVSETVGLNSRLHWIPEAGREIFFVINHNMQDLDLDNRFKSQLSDAAIKVNYTFRF